MTRQPGESSMSTGPSSGVQRLRDGYRGRPQACRSYDQWRVVEMLWGGGDGMARSPPEATDGAPHATAERLEPVTHRSEPRWHLNRDHRDEPIELARRRHRPRDRAPPAEEARG